MRSPHRSRLRPSPPLCRVETSSASLRQEVGKPLLSCCPCSDTSWTRDPWRNLRDPSVSLRNYNNPFTPSWGIKDLSFYIFLLFTAVIMTPTRELALQITKECKKFSKPLGLRVVCVYGGTGISEQVKTFTVRLPIITGSTHKMTEANL